MKSVQNMGNSVFVCVGQTAMRAPDGAPLPAVPLYVKVDGSGVDPDTGLAGCEAELLDGIAGVFWKAHKRLHAGELEALYEGPPGDGEH
jgi:hypothetical protein